MGELNWQNHVDFVIQLGLLAGTAYGFYTFRRSQRRHSQTWLAVTLVNAAAILALMTPRLIDHIPEISITQPDTHALFILSHSGVGVIAAGLSVLLIATWGMANFSLGKCRRRDLMAVTFITWMVAAFIGVLGYLRHTFGFWM